MASRGFYLVSSALVAGTIALVAVMMRSGADATRTGDEPEPDSQVAAGAGEGLGVRAADYDPAAAPAPERRTGNDLMELPHLAEEPRMLGERPVRETVPMAPQPPQLADPALVAEAEASAALQPKVGAELRKALEARRKALRAACWPTGSKFGATFAVQASFGADGKVLSLGVPDNPAMPGVSTCLIGQIGSDPLVLAQAPGVPVAVSVALEFAGPAAPAPPSRGERSGSPLEVARLGG